MLKKSLSIRNYTDFYFLFVISDLSAFLLVFLPKSTYNYVEKTWQKKYVKSHFFCPKTPKVNKIWVALRCPVLIVFLISDSDKKTVYCSR